MDNIILYQNNAVTYEDCHTTAVAAYPTDAASQANIELLCRAQHTHVIGHGQQVDDAGYDAYIFISVVFFIGLVIWCIWIYYNNHKYSF